jgi:hypothetical protein
VGSRHLTELWAWPLPVTHLPFNECVYIGCVVWRQCIMLMLQNSMTLKCNITALQLFELELTSSYRPPQWYRRWVL